VNLEELNAYLDGELPPEARERVEAALRDDPALAEQLRALREVDRALELMPAAEASPAFAARLEAARLRARGGRFRRLVLPIAAAAAAVAAAVALFGGRRPPEEPFAQTTVYVWETDTSTYGSLSLTALEDEVLAQIEGS